MIAARMRIAHVPYAMSLALTKKKVTESAPKPVEPKTVAQTTKGGPRVAHVPQVVSTRKFNQKKIIMKYNVFKFYNTLKKNMLIQ